MMIASTRKGRVLAVLLVLSFTLNAKPINGVVFASDFVYSEVWEIRFNGFDGSLAAAAKLALAVFSG